MLDGCFREPRFNSYIIGEIHVDCPNLIPNSRRDDFVDNEMKTLFYNAVEREIGLPISKEIRHRSRKNSRPYSPSKSTNNIDSVNNSKAADQKFLTQPIFKKEKHEAIDILKEMKEACKGCPQLSKILSLISKKSI